MLQKIRQPTIGAAAIILALAVLVVFSPVLVGRQTFFSAVPGLSTEAGPFAMDGLRTPWTLDPGSYMYIDTPQTIVAQQLVQNGELPTWNPYVGGGKPLSGALINGLYNPLKWVSITLGGYPSGYDFYIALRVWVAGFGMYVLLRRGLSRSHGASLLGSFAYAFSGYFILWLTHWSLAADMWLPYVLLLIQLISESVRWRFTLLLALVGSLLVLSGSPEAVIVAAIFSSGFALFHLWRNKLWRRVLVHFGAAALLIALVSAPMILEMSRFVSESLHAHEEPAALEPVIKMLSRTVALLFAPSSFLEVARTGGLYQGNFLMPYFGFGVILLALFGAAASRELLGRKGSFFLWTIAVFLALISGLPPLRWLLTAPGISKIIFIKYAAPLYLAVTVLAALGFDALHQGVVRRRLATYIGLSLVGLWGLLFVLSDTMRSFYRLQLDETTAQLVSTQLGRLPEWLGGVATFFLSTPYAYTLLLLCVGLAIIGLFIWLMYRKAYTALAVLVVLELLVYLPKLRDGGFERFDPYAPAPFVAFLKQQPDIEQYRIIATGKTLMPEVAGVHRLRDIRSYDGLYLQRYVDYFAPVLGPDPLARITSCWCILFDASEFDASMKQLLDQASVRYVITETELPSASLYQLVYDQEVKIYENKQALPRAYFLAEDGGYRALDITKDAATEVVVRVDNAQDGVAVLNDAFYPGWQATVDGITVAIEPYQTLFRSVKVPAKAEMVTFTYSAW